MYGIDLDDRELLRARSWRWLRARIIGLLDLPESRLYRILNPQPQPTRAELQEVNQWRSL
jgi:hypothetical protein